MQLQDQLDTIFAGLDKNPNKLVAMIEKEIASLNRATQFINYYEAQELDEYTLDQLRLSITNDVFSKSPQQAVYLMRSFLDLHENILEHVDDDNGGIGDVFIAACVDLGEICKHVQMPITDLVDLVFTMYMSGSDYGIYDELISNFQEALQETGLKLLQEKFEQSFNTDNAWEVSPALKHIADCQKDVDYYIRACSLASNLSNHDYIEISKRLIEHERGKEALEWLDKVDISYYGYEADWYSLRIQAFELNKDYELAQKERLAWFKVNLDPQVYQEILKRTEPAFQETFRQETIQRAFQSPNPHTGLSFLIGIKELEESEKFVCLKIDDLNGASAYTLRPIADLLQKTNHPLGATLLYRTLIHPILGAAKSACYNDAAEDLVACVLLAPQITEWRGHQPHEEYLVTLQQTHKRKISFWPKYQSALENQANKAERLKR
jgi:hypothetical protein